MAEKATPKEINTTEERINEMKQHKQDNMKILNDIQAAQAQLGKDRQAFVTYKEAEEAKIDSARSLLARESANHSSLGTGGMQKAIDDLKAQVAKLIKEKTDLQEWYDKENAALRDQLGSLQKT